MKAAADALNGRADVTFDLAREFRATGRQPRDKEDLTPLEYMWLSNGLRRGPRPGLEDAEDFGLPEALLHYGAIVEMDMRALFDTCTGLMELLEGPREPHAAEWLAEFETLLERVRWRAYALAHETLDSDAHNVPDYVYEPPRGLELPEAGDSDDEREIFLADILAKEQERHTEAAPAWVWDMCAMLSWIDLQLLGLKSIALVPAEPKPDLKAERNRVMKDACFDALLGGLLAHRISFIYDLLCNEADRRIFFRKQPDRARPSSHLVLIGKRESFTALEKNGPQSFAEFFTRGDKEAYRVNCDAALHFMSEQAYESVVQQLVLKEWEELPPLEGRPRIIRVRAAGCWGVVFDWPTVFRCSSLVYAYAFLKEESRRRGLADTITAPGSSVMPKRVKLA